MTPKKWFSSGLYFSCKRCSACCRYDPGFVYLTKDEINKMADYLKMDKRAFFTKYCRKISDSVISLKEKLNNDCIFWEKGCIIYNVRPEQCKNFPFWDKIVSSEQSWNNTASGCPGMNTGRLFTQEEILGILKE